MPIKIDKQVTITINGADIRALSNVCEAARVYLSERQPAKYPGFGEVGQFTLTDVCAMKNLMSAVFNLES
jgi:hypothetical protein